MRDEKLKDAIAIHIIGSRASSATIAFGGRSNWDRFPCLPIARAEEAIGLRAHRRHVVAARAYVIEEDLLMTIIVKVSDDDGADG